LYEITFAVKQNKEGVENAFLSPFFDEITFSVATNIRFETSGDVRARYLCKPQVIRNPVHVFFAGEGTQWPAVVFVAIML